MSAAFATLGPGRWHFQHGPIDLVIGAVGRAEQIATALEQAWGRFEGLLEELVAELPLLRKPVVSGRCELRGPVARRMWAACEPFAPEFVTPMAAVAGSVAQEVIQSFERDRIARAYVNNGGDIALWLGPDQQMRIAVAALADQESSEGKADTSLDSVQRRFSLSVPGTGLPPGQLPAWLDIHSDSPVRGVATSGWRGRSLSRGIADSVTVLAPTASQADVAATMIANAIDCEHAAIARSPASKVVDSSDLGELLVTVSVGPLPLDSIELALDRGVTCARRLVTRGLIDSALLLLQGRSRIVANQ